MFFKLKDMPRKAVSIWSKYVRGRSTLKENSPLIDYPDSD